MSQNTCCLVGTLDRPPRIVEGDGPVTGSCTLRIDERRKDGKTYALFVPLDLYGSTATQAATFCAGDMLAVTGSLKWKSTVDKHGEKRGTLAVFVREVHVLEPAGVAAE